MALEAEIGHHRADDARLGEQAILRPAFRDHGQELVAVDQMTVLVGDDDAIGVAVERDADIRAHLANFSAQRVGRRRAAVVVDVETVRFDTDRDHVGAEFPQRLGRHAIGGAVGAIDDDAQAVEREIARHGALGEFDVTVVHAVDALGAAELGAFRQALGQFGVDHRLDLVFDLVGKLVAVGAEQLDAVIVIGVVRGRDHDAEIGAHRARQHGDGGRRHRAEQQHVHADRGEAGDQRRLDHIAGQPRILADHDAMAMLAAAEHKPARLSHFERQFRRDHAIGAAANTIGAEMLANHGAPPLRRRY